MSAAAVVGVAILALLAGVGLATLFVHLVTGGCIP